MQERFERPRPDGCERERNALRKVHSNLIASMNGSSGDDDSHHAALTFHAASLYAPEDLSEQSGLELVDLLAGVAKPRDADDCVTSGRSIQLAVPIPTSTGQFRDGTSPGLGSLVLVCKASHSPNKVVVPRQGPQ